MMKPRDFKIASGTRGYAICTIVRSGSTWLMELLSSTGVLGRPNEYLTTDMMRRAQPDYPSDRLAQIRQVLVQGMTSNNVYALKVFPRQFDQMSDAVLWTKHLPDLRFISLERRDILDQAISRVRALQTQQWRTDYMPTGEARYDADEIWRSLRFVARQQARWRLFFARSGIRPLHLIYEDMVLDPQGTVDAVARLTDVSPSPRVGAHATFVEVQRDEISAAWRDRFIMAHGDLDHLPPF